jgi:hypothetical protein
MLRGDLGRARVKFLKAYQLDPTNPTVVNNLQVLNASYRRRNIRRPAAGAAAFQLSSGPIEFTLMPGA